MDIKDAVSDFTKFASGIDIAVYMPGILQPKLLSKIQHEAILEQVAVNLSGAILMAREVLPIMLRQMQGRIVFVSSASVMEATTGTCIYASAKAGIESLSKGISYEYSDFQIDSISFRLPPVATKMLETVGAKGLSELSATGHTVRIAEPQLVANRMWQSLVQPFKSCAERTIDLREADVYARSF